MDLSKEDVKKIRPIRDLVAVAVSPPKEITTPSGIIGVVHTQSTWQGDELYEGKVVALSNEAKEKAPWLNTKDVVMFHRMHEDYIPTKGEEFIKLVPWSMILGKKLNGKKDFEVEKFEPFFERLVAKVDEESDTTESGLTVVSGKHDSIYEKSTGSGKIVGVAKDIKEGVDKLQIGDRIRWNKFAGTRIEVAETNGKLMSYKNYALIPYHEVLAVIE